MGLCAHKLIDLDLYGAFKIQINFAITPCSKSCTKIKQNICLYSRYVNLGLSSHTIWGSMHTSEESPDLCGPAEMQINSDISPCSTTCTKSNKIFVYFSCVNLALSSHAIWGYLPLIQIYMVLLKSRSMSMSAPETKLAQRPNKIFAYISAVKSYIKSR